MLAWLREVGSFLTVRGEHPIPKEGGDQIRGDRMMGRGAGGTTAQAYEEAWYWDELYHKEAGLFDWYWKCPALAPLLEYWIGSASYKASQDEAGGGDTAAKKAAQELRQETPGEMLSNHREEKFKLQDKETSLKKAATKSSKAEEKAKKKQVDEETSCLSTELEVKHVEELATLGTDP
ncbi:hypothetical protein GUJ93_ZPchr0006g43323 [Zizania palustris]|uniref:Uncharacterized protein n=1 Tax=Zizania palustris TaxID=103762 RepID=A0A8J5W3J9_ZIZPA|nr:hypothetical protein GUJ93_ZPchr0006g43323 [Zizania palustris]